MKLLVHQKSQGTVINTDVTMVEADGLHGKFTVLTEHAPMISPLKSNSQLSFKANNKEDKETMDLQNGFLEVSKENKETIVTLIAD